MGAQVGVETGTIGTSTLHGAAATKLGSTALAAVLPAGALARRLSVVIAAWRFGRRWDGSGLCGSGLPGLCRARRPAAAGRRVRLSAGWSRLRPARFPAPT